MQTNQVNGPANILAAPKQAGKQVDNDGGQGFDQALSREVAGRGEKNASSGDKSETASAPAGKQAEAPRAEKPRSADKTGKTDKSDEDSGADDASATDAAGQFSAEMLALVAAINSITGQNRPDTGGAQTDRQTLELDPGAGKAPVDFTAALGARAGEADDAGSARSAVPAAGTGEMLPETEIGGAGKRGEAAFLDAMQESASRMAAAAPVAQNPAMQAMQAMRNAHPAASDKLAPAVGTPAWDQALGQKVVWMVAGEQQTASLTLNPPDLGPLQVVLSVSNSQASATFTAAQPEVRQALEAALPKLRDMLGEAGIQLGQASVNSGAPNQQGGADQPGNRGNGGNAGGGQGGHAVEGVRTATVVSAGSGNGLVDTFA